MPNVTEGSVVELRYKIISPFIQNVKNIQFQYDIPVNELGYSINLPKEFTHLVSYKGEYVIEPTIEEEKRAFDVFGKRTVSSGIGINVRASNRAQMSYQNKLLKYKGKNIPALASR